VEEVVHVTARKLRRRRELRQTCGELGTLPSEIAYVVGPQSLATCIFRPECLCSHLRRNAGGREPAGYPFAGEGFVLIGRVPNDHETIADE